MLQQHETLIGAAHEGMLPKCLTQPCKQQQRKEGRGGERERERERKEGRQ